MKNFAISGFIILFFCSLCLSDTIILKEGQTLTGDILSEKETVIFIDIGVDVLAIPKDKVLEYEYQQQTLDPDSDANESEQTLASPTDNSQLYLTANLKKTTIEKCVEKVSRAVVKVSCPGGMGSGFLLNEEGYLITNYHVIEKETKIEITVFEKTDKGFEKKRFKKVKIEAINPFVDLALLKIEDAGDTKFKYVTLGDIDNLETGEKVFAIGNPLGLERTVTDGVISTKNRAFEGLVYVQTNADINPGNSGGPLFNLAGQVVGVTNMGYIFFGGLGFAIPVNYVKDFIENREAFAYDKDNPNTGFRYLQPKGRGNKKMPKFLKKD